MHEQGTSVHTHTHTIHTHTHTHTHTLIYIYIYIYAWTGNVGATAGLLIIMYTATKVVAQLLQSANDVVFRFRV